MTRHTFLLEAGMWEATGTFYDEDDEMIVSLYTSAGGIFRGTEHLQRIDANHYRATGCICKGVQKISSWSVELTRMTAGEDRQ